MSQVMTLLLNHREQFHGGTIFLLYHFVSRTRHLVLFLVQQRCDEDPSV